MSKNPDSESEEEEDQSPISPANKSKIFYQRIEEKDSESSRFSSDDSMIISINSFSWWKRKEYTWLTIRKD